MKKKATGHLLQEGVATERRPASDPVAEKFLEHIRTVHFSLVAACFALLVASTVRPFGSLERAYDQARLTSGLMRKAFSGTNLEDFSKRRHAPFLIDNTYYLPLVESEAIMEQIANRIPAALGLEDRVSVEGRSWDVNVRATGNFWLMPYAGGNTLAEFRKAWEFFRAASPVTLDGFSSEQRPRLFRVGGAELSEQQRQVEIHNFVEHDLRAVVRELRLALRLEKDPNRNFTPRRWYVVAELTWQDPSRSSEVNEIWFPIPGRKAVEIDLQSELLPITDGIRLTGAYEDAFGDLQFYARGLESLELSAVIAYLRERYRDDNKKIQILGLEIPLSTLSQWGLVILLGCQGYLALHLLRGRQFWESSSTQFPWVGLYPGLPARLASVVSVSALPASAALLLCWQGWDGTPSWFWRASLLIATLASLSLVVVTTRLWPKPRKENPCPSAS